MKYLASEPFVKSLGGLNADEKAAVARLLRMIEGTDYGTLSRRGLIRSLEYQNDGIFVMNAGHLRIFCNMHAKGNEEYLLLLDISEHRG